MRSGKRCTPRPLTGASAGSPFQSTSTPSERAEPVSRLALMAEEHQHGDVEVKQEERPALDPEARERRRHALSFVRTFGDPSLRSKALAVTRFDERLATEIDRMGALMDDAIGLGLAATQLGVI